MAETADPGSLTPTDQLTMDPSVSSTERLTSIESEVTGGSGDGAGTTSSFLCQICSKRYHQPRVLQCLHVFCTPCLEKLADDDNIGEGDSSDVVMPKLSCGPCKLVCPACKQETQVETAVSELPLDIVTMNAIDASDIRALRMQCTSCKADERAVARCSDCASFLCSNCVTAHKFMRLFENHKVESFDDLQKGDGISIHKPFFCSIHPIESVKFFCSTCQIPVCSECMLCVHKPPEHACDRISDIEAKQTEELNGIVAETQSKILACENASFNLESVLSDLQQQRDNAHDLIKETFQSYKAVLEKRRDDLLKELDDIHSAGELSIMDMYHNVEKAIDKMDTACQFTKRVLEHGNGVEVLSMKKHIIGQLVNLMNGVPHLESTAAIAFETDPDVFTSTVSATFGRFGKVGGSGHSDVVTPESTRSFPLQMVTSGTAIKSEYMSGSPVSPEMAAMLARSGSSLPVGMGHQAINNLQMLMERSISRSSASSIAAGHGGTVDGIDSIAVTGSSHMPFNLNALAKMAPPHGQIPGQPIMGLNLNNSAAMVRANLAQRMNVPVSGVSDQAALAGLLSSVMLTPSPPAAVTPGEIGGLQPTGAITSGSPISVAAAAIAAASLLSGPPPSLPMNGVPLGQPPSNMMPFGISDDTGIVRTRSSGKVSAMQIRCKFGQLGPGKCQFNSPHGFCLGMDEDIVVADTNNHRVQVFEKSGEFKYQFGIPGREEGQLWYPRKVAVIRTSGKYVVCDRGSERSRMQIFTKSGQFIKKIAIRYIDIVAGLAITSQGHIVAVDSVSPTVFCISESGDLIRWFDCSDYMREPSDIAISGKEYFVCDFKGHCVVVFNEEGQFLHRIGCENITNYPNGIDISDAGDVLIGDSHGNRFHIAVFQRDGSLIGEFECPYVKVSRCCGLKITSEGYVVTLAKNNQHVLVLNTLYIA